MCSQKQLRYRVLRSIITEDVTDVHMKAITMPTKTMVFAVLEGIPGALGITQSIVCLSLRGQRGRESLMALNICSLSSQFRQ